MTLPGLRHHLALGMLLLMQFALTAMLLAQHSVRWTQDSFHTTTALVFPHAWCATVVRRLWVVGLDEVVSRNSAGSHWENSTVTITHDGHPIFSETVSVHNRCGENIWLCTDKSILIFQPWCTDLSTAPGFRHYRFDDLSQKYVLVERPGLAPLALWCRNPFSGMDG